MQPIRGRHLGTTKPCCRRLDRFSQCLPPPYAQQPPRHQHSRLAQAPAMAMAMAMAEAASMYLRRSSQLVSSFFQSSGSKLTMAVPHHRPRLHSGSLLHRCLRLRPAYVPDPTPSSITRQPGTVVARRLLLDRGKPQYAGRTRRVVWVSLL